jgi:hypothetical protein
MEYVAGFFVALLRWLAFYAIFFWPGWLVLRIITLGRFPRLRRPSRDVEDFVDVQVVSFIGFITVVGICIVGASLLRS